jgi:hypothetical protein
MHEEFWSENRKERKHYEHLAVGVRIILKYTLQKKDEVVWTGFIWLRMGTSGGLL